METQLTSPTAPPDHAERALWLGESHEHDLSVL